MPDQSKHNDHSPSVDKLERLTDAIRHIERRLSRKRLGLMVLAAVGVLLFGGLLISLLEGPLYMSAGIKSVLWVLVVVAAGSTVGLLQHRQPVSFDQLYPTLSRWTDTPELAHAIDLWRRARKPDSIFHKSALRKNLSALDEQELKEQFDRFEKQHDLSSRYRWVNGGFRAALLFAVALGFIQPDFMLRGVQFWKTYHKPNPYEYTIKPGNTALEQGSTFSPSITFTGSARPQNVQLAVKTDIEGKYRIRPMMANKNGQTYSATGQQLQNDASYYIVMDRYRTDDYRVRVQLRPRFEDLQVSVQPMDYTGLDSTVYHYPFSRIEAYEGSRITLSGTVNKPLDTLRLRQASKDTLLTPDSSRSYRHQLTLTSADTLSFHMADASGLTNENPFSFTLRPEPDQAPVVEIIQPDSTVQQTEPSELTIDYSARDDFGLTRASLHWEVHRAFVEKAQKGSIRLKTPRSGVEASYTWNLEKLGLKPRDEVVYWLEVTDNDQYNGPKTTRSQRMRLQVPSMSAYYDQLDEREQDAQQTLQNAQNSFNQMQQEYDRLKDQLKRNPESNWEQKQQMKEVQKKRKQMEEQLDKLNKKFDDIRKELDKNNMLSDETMKAYNELKKLMEEIDSPELRKALEDMQKALEDMDKNELKRAMDKMEFNEKTYQERLKRTLELFKKLKLNSDLEKMARSLDNLSEQEKELSESELPLKRQMEQQEAVQRDTKQMEQNIDSLSQRAPEDSKKGVQQLQKEAKQQMKDIQQKLQKNMEQMQKSSQQEGGQQNGKPSDKQKQQMRRQQQQLQKQYQKLAQKMRDSKQQMQSQSMKINLAALQQGLFDLLNLSQEQEELTRTTERTDDQSSAFVQQARKQRNIRQQFQRVSDTLYEVSSDIPMLSNRVNQQKAEVDRHLQNAVSQLSERRKNMSTSAERDALGGINKLTDMLADLIDRLRNQAGSGSGGGMSMQQMVQQLKKMSGQQQKLNQQMQQMINDMQGNRLSQGQMDRLNQMAKQQNRIRKQLQEMQRSGELQGGDKMMSDLQRLNEQMEQTINDLRGGAADRQLVKRQRNILSRMLSAEKALNERGKDKKEREATTAKDTQKSTPPQVTLEELRKQIRRRLNDPGQSRFTEDYQRLIEAYFKLLDEYGVEQ